MSGGKKLILRDWTPSPPCCPTEATWGTSTGLGTSQTIWTGCTRDRLMTVGLNFVVFQNVSGPRLFTWWTGREGQTDCPGDNFKYEEIVFISLLTVFKGSGTSKHIGWLDAQGGQGQGGEPQAEVREHCAGPVHRDPHAGQPGFPGGQSKVKEVIQFSFHENYLKKELDLFCRKHRPQNLGSVIKCTAKAVRGAVGGDQKWTFLKNFRCVVIPRWETPRHSLGVSPVLLPSK